MKVRERMKIFFFNHTIHFDVITYLFFIYIACRESKEKTKIRRKVKDTEKFFP